MKIEITTHDHVYTTPDGKEKLIDEIVLVNPENGRYIPICPKVFGKTEKAIRYKMALELALWELATKK